MSEHREVTEMSATQWRQVCETCWHEAGSDFERAGWPCDAGRFQAEVAALRAAGDAMADGIEYERREGVEDTRTDDAAARWRALRDGEGR